ncbi:MAG: hypothetical protein QM778_09915 [Myxococcales bacterium]
MKRKMIGALVGALCCSATLSLDVAHAAPKKKAAKPAAQQEAPQSAGISDAMGDLHWGMTRDEVLNTFVQQIKDKYRPLIAKASGALEEDKLRNKAREELSKIKSSIVDFNGKKTGWDVSFLKGEFSQGNNESMFVVNDDSSQNYYFFINNKLWKWYKAFNSTAFQGKSFDAFASAVQGRYGKAVVKGEGKAKYLAWQDQSSSLRAVDNNQFYGFYCLVFESKDTLARLSDLRPNKASDSNRAHALVESATTDAAEENDNNPDIIDRITGKMRVRQNAPEQSAQAPSTNGKKAPSAAAAPPPVSSGGVSEDDDPLKGLGI